ncbi:hypothetical protein AALB53_08435 [Lachnospiraceae bacterium 47-T17]
MIFPTDVNKRIQNQRKVAGENRVQLVITLFVLGNFVGFFILRYVFVTLLGLSGSIATAVQVMLLIVIGVLVFRFAIFDENAKRRESEGYDSDSFAKYMNIRKDTGTTVDIGGKKVNVFEYSNGNILSIIELKFGSNDNVKSEETRVMYQGILHAIMSHNFICRVIDMSENFKTSDEYYWHINRLNQIEDTKLRACNFDITNAIMSVSEEESNVDCIYVMMNSRGRNQKEELDGLVRELNQVFEKNISAFRSIKYLDINELLEFFRAFYKIEAIDLSMMKTIELAKEIDEDFINIVSIFSLTGQSGKVYRSQKNQKISEISVREKHIQ